MHNPSPTQALPLAGYRVIDYSHFLAGPYLSRCLAALGAEVIKVERPTTGDAGRQHAYFINGQSGYFLQQNMGKKGLCINLKDPRGQDIVRKLIHPGVSGGFLCWEGWMYVSWIEAVPSGAEGSCGADGDRCARWPGERVGNDLSGR